MSLRHDHDGRRKDGSGFVGYGDRGVQPPPQLQRRTANTRSTHIVGHMWAISFAGNRKNVGGVGMANQIKQR